MDSFEALYRREINYIRELGRVAAQENTQLEAFFGQSSVDPDVERLVEGFSALTAGISRKIEDGFPELTAGILSRVWPFPLRPIPSTSIIQLTPKKGHQRFKSDIAKGVVVTSGNGIEFKTCRDLHVEPLTLLSKKLTLSSEKSMIELTFSYNEEGVQWRPEPFSLYLGNDQKVAAELRLWLDQYQTTGYLLCNGSTRVIEQGFVFPHQYRADSLVIPHEQDNYWSIQLLAEYFYLPHVNDFISIDLSQAFPMLERPKKGHFTLQLMFEGILPLTQADINQSFILNCVPVVNLTAGRTRKIPFDPATNKYHLPAKRGQIFTPLNVYTDQEPDDEKQGERKVHTSILEQHRYTSLALDDDSLLYYEFVTYKDEFERVKYQIRFYDASTNPLRQTEYACFNCDYLALDDNAPTLAIGAISTPGIDITGGWLVRNITPVTPSYPAITNSHIHWRLLNQLSFHPVYFNDLEAVKAAITDFNLHGAINVQLARQLQRRIDSLLAVEYRPIDRLFKGQVKRGIQLNLTIDETYFDCLGAAYLFVEVLAHFFSFVINESSYLLTKVTLKGTGEEWRFSEIFGGRKLM